MNHIRAATNSVLDNIVIDRILERPKRTFHLAAKLPNLLNKKMKSNRSIFGHLRPENAFLSFCKILFLLAVKKSLVYATILYILYVYVFRKRIFLT